MVIYRKIELFYSVWGKFSCKEFYCYGFFLLKWNCLDVWILLFLLEWGFIVDDEKNSGFKCV